MREDHLGDLAHMVDVDLVRAVVRRLGLSRPRTNEVGAVPGDLERDRDLRDEAQDLARQADWRERTDPLRDPGFGGLLRLGVPLRAPRGGPPPLARVVS